MAVLTTHPPARRSELVIKPFGNDGLYVVKDPCSGEYFQLDEQSSFLLLALDGRSTLDAIRTAYAERFGAELSGDDFDAFVEQAREQGWLETVPPDDDQSWVGKEPVTLPRAPAGTELAQHPRRPILFESVPVPGSPNKKRQSILHWRHNLFDPDRFFTWLEPKIRFFWTRTFLVFSNVCILLALGLVWINRRELVSNFADALRWETLLAGWLIILAVTFLHEFAHGLTCKHHGGEVHEIGFLLMYLMPCFFCNVSDAWLFREKSKRLWVTLAGGYFELFLWALAVFCWRLTVPDSLLNYLCFVILTVCGVQTLFNCNPLMKLDGYYLLSDWLEVPNLQQQSATYFRGHVRRVLWGAPQPEHQSRAGILVAYDLVSWTFSIVFLCLSLAAMYHYLGTWLGPLGIGAVGLLGYVSIRGAFRGLSSGEVRKMISTRHKRTALWLLFLTAVPVALFVIPMEDRSSGTFQLRPSTRAELRAPVAGFLRAVSYNEGDRVAAGALVATLEVSDLVSRRAQKDAEVCESQAKLRLLEAGTRYEEMQEQRRRVARAEAWEELAGEDLVCARTTLEHDLVRLDAQIRQYRAEMEYAESVVARSGKLLNQRSLSEEQHHESEKKVLVGRSQLEQAEAQRRARQTQVTREAETELKRREKELAEARAALALMEAGTRPEEIEAERARLARLQEEARYLESLNAKLLVHSPVEGLVTTPRLNEKVGQYLHEGNLICLVEEPGVLEAEISLAEQDVHRVQVGNLVALKARAHPLQTFETRLDRIAPTAGKGEVQSSVTVYCRVDDSAGCLRPGMTGLGRVYAGRRPVGAIMFDRAIRFLRTEFWW